MAAIEKSVKSKHRPKNVNTTFESSRIDPKSVEEKLYGHVEEDEDDEPVVFICGKCQLPVGDSKSWDGSEDAQNQIRLKRVTDNVLMGKDNRVYEASSKSFCLITDLSCRGCRSVLGMVYTSTPKNLDHKRLAFCLNVADIDSYVLGSGSQMLAAEGPKEQPVTLQYRNSVEHQIEEMKTLIMTMAQRLEDMGTGLPKDCDKK